MELQAPELTCSLPSITNLKTSAPPIFHLTYTHRRRRLWRWRSSLIRSSSATAKEFLELEQPGGKMVVELVGAFNELTERMKTAALLSTSSCRILFKALKLSIPILQTLPISIDGRSPLSKALSLALFLADLQMDAEVIAAGILREVWEAGAISLHEVRAQIGTGTAHLLHESLRVKKSPFQAEILDDENAVAIRRFCLTYYDIRAVVLDLSLKLDMMRHLEYLPRYQQQIIALEVMKIHAPLARAVGTHLLSLELEDLSFRYLFPSSYLYVDTWLKGREKGSKDLLETCKEHLIKALRLDPTLQSMIDNISVKGRYKSRYSTMKKLLKDGRKPEEVYDIMGLRVVLKPKPGVDVTEMGDTACYRTREIIQSLWKEIPQRTKDYIAKPKANGYRSLHMAVDVSHDGHTLPLMEIQIRTTEMDLLATGGNASHSLYKSGLTDPQEAKRLKAIMVAAAELAALRLKDLPSMYHNKSEIHQKDGVFSLLDKNGDGRISIEELMEVMEELGAQPEDAQEMMQLLDSNSDGSLSSDEFDSFQKQIELMRNIEDRDEKYKVMLEEKLPMADESGLIQIYRNELCNGVAIS